MRHEHNHHKRTFLINYVSKFNKGMSNGCNTTQTTIISAGNATANGKNNNLIQRAKTYCMKPFISSNNSSSFNSSRFDNENLYKLHTDNDTSFFRLIDDDNDSECGALISGDERFAIDDAEFNDDDCVALEPRDHRMSSKT